MFHFQEFLSFRDPHVANYRLQLEHPEELCERWFRQPWDELVAAHLRLEVGREAVMPRLFS